MTEDEDYELTRQRLILAVRIWALIAAAVISASLLSALIANGRLP